MKRKLAILLALGLLLVLIPLIANAETVKSGKNGKEITWTLDEEGVLTFTGKGIIKTDFYSWQDDYDDFPSGVKKIIIEDGITGIGPHFHNKLGNSGKNLEAIEIADSVVKIDEFAFYGLYGCENLKSVTLGNGLKSIGDSAFSYCASLNSITIPNSVTSMGDMVFYECANLEKVILGNSLDHMGCYIFGGCGKLENVIIPQGLTHFGTGMFIRCTGLKSISIPSGLTSIYSQTFSSCTNLSNITIPNTVMSIGERAFYECTGLTSLTIPNSVQTIDDKAFQDCRNLTSIKLPDSMNSIGYGAFFNCISLLNITLPNNLESIAYGAFGNCTSLASVTFSDSITSIGETAFEKCSSLKSITLPPQLSVIYKEAFGLCTNLTSIIIPKSLTTVEKDAFAYTSLNDVYYSGTESNRKTIKIASGNDFLKNATWHYESDGTISESPPASPSTPTEPTEEIDPIPPTEETDPVLPAEEIDPVSPTEKTVSISLDKTKLTIKDAKPQTITATLSNPNDSIASVKSSKDTYAKVSCSGNRIIVTPGKKAGKATITVITTMGAEAKFTVTVKEGWSLNEKKLTMKKGEKFKIKLNAVPSSIKIKSCESSKPKVAKVDKKGKITAKKKGKATITVTLSNGKTLKLKVTVK